jgi:hypothetical protein
MHLQSTRLVGNKLESNLSHFYIFNNFFLYSGKEKFRFFCLETGLIT